MAPAPHESRALSHVRDLDLERLQNNPAFQTDPGETRDPIRVDFGCRTNDLFHIQSPEDPVGVFASADDGDMLDIRTDLPFVVIDKADNADLRIPLELQLSNEQRPMPAGPVNQDIPPFGGKPAPVEIIEQPERHPRSGAQRQQEVKIKDEKDRAETISGIRRPQ